MTQPIEFFVRMRLHAEVRVVVRGRAVELTHPTKGFLYSGVWDDGGYVRYQRVLEVPVSPLVLDEIDSELRLRMPRSSVADAHRMHLNRTRRCGRRRPKHAILDLPQENLRAARAAR